MAGPKDCSPTPEKPRMNTEKDENKHSDQPYYHNLPNILQQTEESDLDANSP